MLKYLKKKDKGSLEQIERYASSRGLIDRQDVKRAVIVFLGKDGYEIV